MPTTDKPRTAKARWILEEWETEGGSDNSMREALIEVERQAIELGPEGGIRAVGSTFDPEPDDPGPIEVVERWESDCGADR